MRSLVFGLTAVAAVVATAVPIAAWAVDISVTVRNTQVGNNQRYDPLATDFKGGDPDLIFCYRQDRRGQVGEWKCDPDLPSGRRVPVGSTPLPCRDSLNCVFRNLAIEPGLPFEFELRDADVTQNEIIERGTCVFDTRGLDCRTQVKNATFQLVSASGQPSGPVQTGTTQRPAAQPRAQQGSAVQAAPAPQPSQRTATASAGRVVAGQVDRQPVPRIRISDPQLAAVMALADGLEREYFEAVTEQNFEFCRDPETAIRLYIEAGQGIPAIQALAADPENGWRVAHRMSQALIARVGTSDANEAGSQMMRDFSSRPELLRNAISELQSRRGNQRLASAADARRIFRDRCL